MEWLLAAQSIPQRSSFHDISQATHDRGHADPQSRSPHPEHYVFQVSMFARHFSRSPEVLGPEEIRTYQVYLTNEKKLAVGSILIAIAALRFLYKVTLKKDWTFEEIILTPKKPQKLPIVLSPEEVIHFLNCVAITKHRVILTTCYAAGPAHLRSRLSQTSRH
jgi:integrase/recombinase XerD